METTQFNLELPESGGVGSAVVESQQSIVIIGANGSGKTRLGTWLDSHVNCSRIPHRISAQKSLTMPELVSYSDLDTAKEELLFGSRDAIRNYGTQENAKNVVRWGQKPNTFLLNDFEKLMVLLFSEEAEMSIGYRHSQRVSSERLPITDSRLDIIKRIWELVLPHRELKIGAGKVQTRVRDGNSDFYSGSEMSDGERVIFYLIGQALSAPDNGMIIIDEPELHLHRSVQTRLWREIQSARPDCLFVYMTHDVEFAASLTEAKKIWLKSYDGHVWEWEEVPKVDDFPEDLLLQILGTRRPILFVEGENGSYDLALFEALYPHHRVISRGGCSQVILSTKVLRQMPQFHHLRVCGIVDRDRLNAGQIAKLKADGVEVLKVAEVENLFCIPEILGLVAEQQGFSVDEKIKDARNLVLRELQKDLGLQISLHAANEIRFRLNDFDPTTGGVDNLQDELNKCFDNIDVASIYAEIQQRFNDVVQSQNFLDALCLFNRKGLATQLSGLFGLKKLPDYVLRMLQSSNPERWIAAFANHMPNVN